MERKQVASIVVDAFIVLAAALCLLLLYHSFNPAVLYRRILTAAILTPVIAIVVYETVCHIKPAKATVRRTPSISALTLLGEDGRPIRIWDMTGKVGLLIGKSSEEVQVDIDLSETDYHTYIDPEHAILNYNDSGWWLQDTSSRNGISIIRQGNELALGRRAPARLEPGDIICVAQYTKIAVN